MNNDIHYMRKELDRLQTKVSNFDVTTEYAYSDSDTTAPSNDASWTSEKLPPVDGQFIWARTIMNLGYGDIITEPYCIGDGLEHITSIDVEYIAWSSPNNPPNQDNPYWQTTAPSIQKGQYIWSRTIIVTTKQTKYTSPVRVTGLQGENGETGKDGIDGKSGKDGKGIEFIFRRVASKVDNWNNPPTGVTNPANLNPVQTDDYFPNDWTDDQEEVTENFPFQYVSTRTRSIGDDGITGEWSKFNTPKLWSVYGEKPYCHIRYADVNNPQKWSQTYPTPAHHKYEGYLWNNDETLADADKDPSKFSWRIYRPTIGIAGEEGSFLHIAFAEDESGAGFNQDGGAYMGTCVTYEEVDPSDPDLYNWVRIRGNDGVGDEFVYYTTDNDNYTSLPSNIQNTPALNRWCERPYSVSEQYQYCYISVREYDSATEQWDSWSSPVLWAKYGADGQQGGQGERGEDGVGLEMIFCRNNSTETPPSFVNGQNKATFTGKVNDKSYQDTDFVPQNWSDNQQGVNSDNTVEWVSKRYKRCPTGSKVAVWGDFNTPKVWATYSEDGRGVLSIQEEYGVSISSSVQPTTWVTDATQYLVNGEFEKGKWYWTRTKITYSEADDNGSDIEYVGVRIVNMVDSDSEHYIFYRTATNDKPAKPTANTEIITNINQEGKNINTNAWFEDVIAPTPQLRYLWCSQQSYDGLSKGWSDYCEPYLVDTYVFYGSNGEEGETGLHGADGTQLTGDEIEDKTTDTTTKTMTDSVPSNFVSETGNFYKEKIGEFTTNINRQGNIVLINLRATLTNSSSETGYVHLMDLPSWAIPYEDCFFSDVVHLTDQSLRYRIRQYSDGTGDICYWKEHSEEMSFNMTGTAMYFADDSVREEPTITLESNHSMAFGNEMVIKLSNKDNQPICNTVVYFKVNGVIYKRTTDAINGTARLNINFTTRQSVTVWYDGYDYKDDEIMGVNENYTKTSKTFVLFMKPTTINQINYGSDSKGYYVEFIAGTGKPYRYSDIDLDIGRKGYWTTQTDGKGRVYFDLMGYDSDKGVEVNVRVNKSEKIMYVVNDTQVLKNDGTTFITSSFPTEIPTVTGWENTKIENLTSMNDSRYVQTVLLDNDDVSSNLKIGMGDLNIPYNGVVSSLRVVMRYTSLEGNTQLERPSFDTPLLQGGFSAGADFSFVPSSSAPLDYTNCGKWQTVEYTYTGSRIDENNQFHGTGHAWDYLYLHLMVHNYGGGSGHSDKGRFAIDYVKLEAEYTIDNSKSLLPTNGLISFNATDKLGSDGYYYGVNTNRYSFNVLEDNNPVADTNVQIDFNNNSSTVTTNANGRAVFMIPPNTAVGTYIIHISIDDFETYQFIEVKPSVWLESDELEIFAGGTGVIRMTGVDSEGDPLYGGDIRINIDGHDYVTSFDRGVAEYEYTSTEVGEHIAIVHINTDVYDVSIPVRITVLPRLTGEDVTKYYRCSKQYDVLLVDEQGNGMNNETIIFEINKVQYSRKTTTRDGVDGIARINLNLQPNDYVVTATWGNVTIQNNIHILPVLSANDLTMKYGDGSKFVAKLVDCEGNPYPNNTIEFNVNGVFYQRLTDTNGEAKLNINLQSGEYFITSSFNGTNIANTIIVK